MRGGGCPRDSGGGKIADRLNKKGVITGTANRLVEIALEKSLLKNKINDYIMKIT